MSMTFIERLQAVDQTMLTPLVHQVLADDWAELLDWCYKLIEGDHATQSEEGYGIYRFRGQARSQGKVRTWSLILKVTAEAIVADNVNFMADPADTLYWKREVLIYQSDWLVDLPEGLAAPRCFMISEYPGQEFWLWLEDIKDRSWTLNDYGLVAQGLGQFNGAYLCGHPIAQAIWLSTGRIRPWLSWGEASITNIKRLSQYPLNQILLGPDGAERLAALWTARERLLTTLAHLPRTFCHHDAWGRNLMIRSNSVDKAEIVAIDWALAGTGSVGEEIATLVGMGISPIEIEPQRIKELEDTVLAGYIAGLQQAGWQGDPRLARLGYAITISLSYALGRMGTFLAMAEEYVKEDEETHKKVTEEILPSWSIYLHHLLDLADEALTLANELAIPNLAKPEPNRHESSKVRRFTKE